MTAQARIAAGYYERDDVKEIILDAVLEELDASATPETGVVSAHAAARLQLRRLSAILPARCDTRARYGDRRRPARARAAGRTRRLDASCCASRIRTPASCCSIPTRRVAEIEPSRRATCSSARARGALHVRRSSCSARCVPGDDPVGRRVPRAAHRARGDARRSTGGEIPVLLRSYRARAARPGSLLTLRDLTPAAPHAAGAAPPRAARHARPALGRRGARDPQPARRHRHERAGAAAALRAARRARALRAA